MPRAQHSPAAVDATRQRLAALALDIYRVEGLDAISFRRLAEAAGISHTLPYRYFDSKEALLVALRVQCMEHFEQFVRAREPSQAAPMPRIESLAAAYVEYVRAHPADYQLIFSTHQPAINQYPDLLAARRSLFEHAVSVVQHAIDAGVLHGDARVLTHLFWISLHGLMTLHAAGQLVHGLTLEALIAPLVTRMVQTTTSAPTPGPAASKPAPASADVIVLAPRRRKPTA
ncbi:TetR/AcrR family transcriptional regulator [Nevskia sp.]|uniref:TetR/AcrR family transcriptional regulator n=1 Tax=Nevskia sp. TaxID=1929292 RepID=UPI0025E142FE|nr:TetR/AcrR family transcriptional regulator [Nevskia sp.]